MKDDGQSIYRQLNASLRTLVSSGDFRPGSKFLTEREISKRFGVSRPTANKALASLVSEGVLEFRKGVGTFFTGGGLDYDLRSLVSFTDRARVAGRRPATRVLQFKELGVADLPPLVVARLKLAVEDRVYYTERLRSADGVPLIFERRHIVARWCQGLKSSDLRASLYGVWTEKFGLRIAGAEQSIRALNLSKADAALLEVTTGAAALQVVATGYIEQGQPLWLERTLYRADQYEFHSHLGGLRPVRPAVGRFSAIQHSAGG